MQVFGRDEIATELEGEYFSFKALMNADAISLFKSRRGNTEVQHRSHKRGGLSYEDNYRGNALALIIKPGLIEIRFHDQFSDDRVRTIIQEIKQLPELAFARSYRVTYQGREIDRGSSDDSERRV